MSNHEDDWNFDRRNITQVFGGDYVVSSSLENKKKLPDDIQNKIVNKCNYIKEMLLRKNRKYGNSALGSVQIFSTMPHTEKIGSRIDEKISRIMSNQDDDDEDAYEDLAGYFILLLIARDEREIS